MADLQASEPIRVAKWGQVVSFSRDELDEAAAFHATLANITDPMRPTPPPLPEPGPNETYVALLDAARAASPVLAELVELHAARPQYYGSWCCDGDEFSGYDGEAPDWPCDTTRVIARHLGVEVSGG